MAVVRSLFGANVRASRHLAGLSQKELAGKAGIKTQHLSNIEQGRAFASAELVGRLAAALKITPAELFYSGLHPSRLPGNHPDIRTEVRRALTAAEERICAVF
jgi:transcriptional regulator with XRE-family HTH domain